MLFHKPPISQDIDIIDLTSTTDATSDADSGHPSSSKAWRKRAKKPQWYENVNEEHPFRLCVNAKAGKSSAALFTQIVFFPWDGEMGLDELWNGEVYYSDDEKEESIGTPSTSRASSSKAMSTTPIGRTAEQVWYKIRSTWANHAAMCGSKMVTIMHMVTGKVIFHITLPTLCEYTLSHVCWAIDPWTLHPLIIYVHSSVMHVFDVETRQSLGCMRGHGGDITSIGVHLRYPHLVYTTSRDCTSRIYDFRVTSQLWMEAGIVRRDPFGMSIDDNEGDCSLGKCVTVLTGGRSGGHEAAVLGADFHPNLPLIATCGMDHAVRIWHLSPVLFKKKRFQAQGAPNVHREDKPLFSSTTIHDARVLAVYWLSAGTLLSHSAPAIRTVKGRPVEGSSGTIITWQWLSVGRFFPPGNDLYNDPPLRGCISDYRESASYKLVSLARLPEHAKRIILNRHARRPPLVMIPVEGCIMIVNVCHLPVRRRPNVLMAGKGKSGNETAEKMMDEVIGWYLSKSDRDMEEMRVEGCEMSGDGRIVVGVGDLESVWIWTRATNIGNNSRV